MAFRSALDAFLARAEAQPDAPAILEDGRLAHTYASLARAALCIGASLREHGAGPEQLVGVALPKSADLVAALLGAWAAGAAFTVLDPALPAARRAVQIDEGRIRCILTTGAHRAALAAELGGRAPALPALPMLPILIDIMQAQRAKPLAAPVPAAPEHLAYACWTSGSTGRPKGVAVEHRGLPGMLAQQLAAFGLGPGQRSLFVLSTTFDAAISDIGTALLSGACLCIEPALARPGISADTIQSLLHARAITYVDIPPALLALLDPAKAPPSLATVVIGGEVCPLEAVRAWAGRVRLVNVYGPTEATVCTSLCTCTPAWARPLLGAPLDGVRYRVVDEGLRALPPGQPGQLAIGGVQVARGYIGQPALAAARFATIDGERCFLTGDRVVHDLDGSYRFLGRMDRQVKIRGQLAAPEEIEAALIQHPGVARAHVQTRTHAGRTTLHAFVAARSVAAPGATPGTTLGPLDSASLRRHLADQLPAWMLPQRIEILDALPETTAGKIDGEALAALRPEPAVPESGRASGAAERALAHAAARLLGSTDVDVRCGFVSLGGDSLSILELAAAAAAAGVLVSAGDLAADVPLRDLARGQAPGPALPAAELDRAAALPADLAARLAAPAPSPCGARAILVTGATGFLGARLVLELGQRSDATLFCLVRARDGDHAWQRLRAACDAHAPGRLDALGRRVRVLSGDLTLPGLALDARARAALVHEIDAVYHCAARVDMVAPFASLAPHNLDGTAEILRLCVHGRRKPLHHASTLSVLVSTDRASGRLDEADDLDGACMVFGGYAQSKWAAERLVRRASALPAAVYRFGLITGDLARGPLPARDFLVLLTRGLAALRAVPAAWLDTLAIDITPVGFAAAAMAAIGQGATGDAAGTYHIAGRAPVPLRAWVQAMRATGVILDEVSEQDWTARLTAPAPPGQPAPGDLERAIALLGMSRGAGASAFAVHRGLDMFQATGVTFGSCRADAALRGTGLERPVATPALLASYVQRILENVP